MPLPLKHEFELPEGMIYLDGNSLGPLTKGVANRVEEMINDQWGAHLIKGWNQDGWMAQPLDVGDRIASLVGAPARSIAMGDTLSVKVYQALSAALSMRPDRKVIVSDTGNFPSDLYMAQGLIHHLAQAHDLRIVAPEDVTDAIDDTVAAVMLTHVDYRSGRMHDMSQITKAAHAAGAVMIWDLAHSAGAVPVELTDVACEFAVGCTYKYLNGGPGAPAFIYVRPDIVESISPALSGWLGHAAPFDFDLKYAPGAGVERMRVGTPSVIQMAALSRALDVWDTVDMAEVRSASIALSERFIAEVEARCPELTLASPRSSEQRGSQVSFTCENSYAVMQALIAQDVIGDFRAPNVMRFGFTPLYLDNADIGRAVDILQNILDDRLWDRAEFKARKTVT